MAGSLTPQQAAAYRRDGFLFPLDPFTRQEAGALRSEVESLEARHGQGSLPRDIGHYFRVNAQLVIPLTTRVALHPAVLDMVESVLGSDILLWSCELFIKEAHTPKIVSWHQDLTYWGLGETDEEVTAWMALSAATTASGCMRFLAGSHNQRIVEHHDTFSQDNLLSRGQELAVDVDEAAASDVILQPGQMSLHHGRMFHASGPNTSDDRRIGLAIRYVTPRVRQLVNERDYALLARGVDRERNWINVAPPCEPPFNAAALTLYEQVLEDQSAAFSQDAEQTVGLYS
jgi:ectoine hydroxylase-related dioxygenase (phytanoyl-CoA dioxygenase family)